MLGNEPQIEWKGVHSVSRLWTLESYMASELDQSAEPIVLIGLEITDVNI